MVEQYTTVGTIPSRSIACSTVLARRELDPIPLGRTVIPDAEQRWLSYLSGNVATARLVVGGEDLAVASVRAIANEVDHPAVTDANHERIRRRVLHRAWHNDLVVAALTPGW